jgi:hypothetical protein
MQCFSFGRSPLGPGGNQISPLHENVGGLLQFMVIGLFSAPARDEHHVPSRFKFSQPDDFSQPAFHLVPGYGIAQSLAYHESIAILAKLIGQDSND